MKAVLTKQRKKNPVRGAIPKREKPRPQPAPFDAVSGLLGEFYLAVAGKPLVPGLLQTFSQRAAEEGTLAGVLAEMLALADFRKGCLSLLAPELVRAAYRGLLGRDADAAGLAAYAPNVRETRDIAPMLSRLAGSEEFTARHADPDRLKCTLVFNEAFLPRELTPGLIRAAFSLILGRPASPADVESHLALPTAGALRDTLLKSAEFRQGLKRLTPTHRPAPDDLEATKTVFLHIPKTGGTTMHAALQPFFERGRTCPERFNALYRYPVGDLAYYRFFSGHFSLESCRLIPGPKRIFTMLRHPLDRLVSKYNFVRAHSEEIVLRLGTRLPFLARQHDLREYLSLEEIRRHPSVNNVMVRALASAFDADRWESASEIADPSDAMGLVAVAKQNLRSLLTFGILERYDESVALIFNALSLPVPAAIKREMVLTDLMGKAVGIETIEPQMCDAETREIMMPLIEADLALYEDALGLFEQRVAAARAGEASAAVGAPAAVFAKPERHENTLRV